MAKDVTNVPGIGPQKPQAPEDKQGPGYDNDTPDSWLRGMGPGQATGKPGFDHSKKGR